MIIKRAFLSTILSPDAVALGAFKIVATSLRLWSVRTPNTEDSLGWYLHQTATILRTPVA